MSAPAPLVVIWLPTSMVHSPSFALVTVADVCRPMWLLLPMTTVPWLVSDELISQCVPVPIANVIVWPASISRPPPSETVPATHVSGAAMWTVPAPVRIEWICVVTGTVMFAGHRRRAVHVERPGTAERRPGRQRHLVEQEGRAGRDRDAAAVGSDVESLICSVPSWTSIVPVLVAATNPLK